MSILLFSGIIFAKKQNVLFKYTPNVVPRSVALAGSFNNWSTSADMMSDDNNDGVWTIELELEDGEYQYKFVVNGDYWYHDSNNPLSAPDGYGGRNSILRVGDYGRFQKSTIRGDGDILTDAVFHEMDYPYFAFSDDSTLHVKLRTKQDDIDSAYVVSGENHIKMDWYAFDGTFDYYIATIPVKDEYFEYCFKVYDSDKFYEDENIFRGNAMDFPVFDTPSWLPTAVFYQIFPERFCNGDKSNDPKKVRRWGEKPEYHNFFGGDLKGIIDNLDYLSDLGINALYLNPVFQAPSNHKYDMSDMMIIDPHFGDIQIFKELLDSCHARDIKVMLDGVFHDTGREHWAFQDVIKNEMNSPYARWYNIHSFPIGPIDKPNYECWWGFGSLPSLMTTNPEVRKYLFEVTNHWTEMGIDGWRLDCPNEVEDEFWLLFRNRVRSINPECYILGEIWGDGGNWLKGDMFDAVMNYRFRDACLDFFAFDKITSSEFAEKYFSVLASYYPFINNASFNLLGSHDTPRFITLCNGDKDKLKLAWLFQMTMLGAPSIYYGDEIGMEGGKDPDCRRCFQWDTLAQDRELSEYMKELIKIRKEIPAIALGHVNHFITPDDNTILFFKEYKGSKVIIAINRSDNAMEYTLEIEEDLIQDLQTGKRYEKSEHTVSFIMKPKSGRIFHLGPIPIVIH